MSRIKTLVPFKGLPKGRFGVIAIDPPWHFRVRSKKGEGRSPIRHYQTMTVQQIMDLPVRDHAASNCMLMLWITGPHLRYAFDVIKAWGFQYVGLGFVWLKLKRSARTAEHFSRRSFHFGLGYTTRHNAELVLFARRGNPKRINKSIDELIFEPVREHSRKPEEFYSKAEQLYPGPRADIFAREKRKGWTAWGNQVGKYGQLRTSKLWKSTSHERKTVRGGVRGKR